MPKLQANQSAPVYPTSKNRLLCLLKNYPLHFPFFTIAVYLPHSERLISFFFFKAQFLSQLNDFFLFFPESSNVI